MGTRGSRRACPLSQPLLGGCRPSLCPHPTLRASPCSHAVMQRQRQEGQGLQAEDQGPDSRRARLRAHTPTFPQRPGQSVPGLGLREPAANARACGHHRVRGGREHERGLRRDPAAQLPCPPWGLRRSPSLRTSSSRGHLPSSPRPLNHGPAPARAYPACHVAPPGHHRRPPHPPTPRSPRGAWSGPVPGGGSCRRQSPPPL